MFNRVTAKLSDPGRRTQRGTEVSHLLSFIARCGECGDHALLGTYPHTSGAYTVLGCKTARNVGIREDVADAYVEEHIISWFERKDVARAALVPDESDAAARVEAAQRLINGYEEQLREARQLASRFDPETGRPGLSAGALAELEQTLGPRLEAERRKLQGVLGVSPLLLRLLAAGDPDVVWQGLSLDQRREVVRRVVTVRLHKARHMGVRRLEPGRITLAFVGEPGFLGR
jgi:hypothetical protein